MSQALSYQETHGTSAIPVRRASIRSGNAAKTVREARVTREPPSAVPMLDWPVDLFSDNAVTDELVTVDFLMQCDADEAHTTH